MSNLIILPEELFRSILKEELQKILSESNLSQSTILSKDSKKPIRGILGLAKFLNVSNTTAQALKNSGKLPFSQVGRVVLFDPDKVMEAMDQNNKPRKR